MDDSEALDLNIADIDLGDVAAEATRRLEPLFVEKDVDLVLHVSEPTPIVGDRDRLVQVFTNIVGNAITYTPPGGTVTLTAHQRGPSASVTIADTGKGLDPEDVGRIFDRFQRVDPDLPGGTGVGLTVARSLVRRHGGEISAESDGIGKGSRFIVSLPVGRT